MSEQDRFRRFSEGLPSRRGLVIVSCPKCQKKLDEYETKVTRLTEHAYERIDLGRDAPGLVAFDVKVCDLCMEKLRKNPKARPGQYLSRPPPGLAEGYLRSVNSTLELTYLGEGDHPSRGRTQDFLATKEGKAPQVLQVGRIMGDQMTWTSRAISDAEWLYLSGR